MRFDFDRFDFTHREAGAHHPAVIHAEGALDWAWLAQAVEDWETAARHNGVRPDEPVMLTGHKEPAFLVAMLGCLRLGAPFVPVDVINPPDRITRIAQIVSSGVLYDAQAQAFRALENIPAPLAEKGVAYIMFTSGSTGDPKGVQIGRESLGLFAGWIRDDLKLGESPAFVDQILFSFDYSLFNWTGALATGGSCILCTRETIADRAAFLPYLAKAKASVWATTPSFLRQQFLDPAFSQAHLPDMKVFVFGAESLTPRMAETVWERFPEVRIINSYGPTEATCSTTWVEIDPELRARAPLPFPIGRAKPYADVFIADEEISVAGDHVMRGYINRPDLNATRMFTRNGKRGYRTGDVGVMDEAGLVTFRGRRDDQIKLHGYRIELAEIDSVLATLPGVRAGAAIALKRPDGTLVRIVGVVELSGEGPSGLLPLPETLADWREILGRRLPHYMVPSELLASHGFPLTQTDKADRKRLEQLYLETSRRPKQESGT